MKSQSGQALIAAIYISVILTTIIAMFFLYLRMQHRFIANENRKTMNLYYCRSTIQEEMADIYENGIVKIGSRQIKINDGKKSVVADVKTGFFGFFPEIIASVGKRKRRRTIRSRLGLMPPRFFSNALILSDPRHDLIVGGNTRIFGNVVCNRIKPGIFQGRGYTGDRLNFGQLIRPKADQFPRLNTYLISERLKALKQKLSVNRLEPVPIEATSGVVQLNDSLLYIITEPVFADSLIITGPGTIILPFGLSFNGTYRLQHLVRILSADSLSLGGSGQLDDVLFYTEKTTKMSGNIRGNAQIISGQAISIENEVQLEYPSLLLVYNEKSGNPTINGIHLAGHCAVTGIICSYVDKTEENRNRERPAITMGKSCRVNGFIYTNSVANISGEINGCVSVDQFYFYSSPTSYINWLVDVVIDRQKINDKFLFPYLFQPTKLIPSEIMEEVIR